jgi:TrmH family RNA methyltransferase
MIRGGGGKFIGKAHLTVRIVLVGTTHPGNIGAVARAMKNMGLENLLLVNPRHFPHEDATARASGAEDVLDAARVIDSLADAIGDCHYVAGASARPRSIGWPTMTPRDCAGRLHKESEQGVVAAVFGPEKSGLTNEDLDLCHTLVTIPAIPDFSSLNLAMAVQVLCYELRVAALNAEASGNVREVPLASAAELQHFYLHLEQVLTASGFLDTENPRYLMRRLRRLFLRAEPDRNEINILRGILASLDPRALPRQAEDRSSAKEGAGRNRNRERG